MSDDKNRDVTGARFDTEDDDILEIEATYVDDADDSYADETARERDLTRQLQDEDSLAEEGMSDFDFPEEKSGGSGMKKLIAPAIVLIAALGIGGYMLTKPSLMDSTSSTAINAPAASPALADNNAPIGISPVDGASVGAAGLPQPNATQNDMIPPVAGDPNLIPPADPASATQVADASAAGNGTDNPSGATNDWQDPLVAAPATPTTPPSDQTPALPDAAQAGSVPPDASQPATADAATPPVVPPVTPPTPSVTASGEASAPLTAAATPTASTAPAAPETALADIARDVNSAPATNPNDPLLPMGGAPLAVTSAPQPDPSDLRPAGGMPADAGSPTAATSGVSAATATPSGRTARPVSDAYYDSNDNVPAGQVANATKPRKVDPTIEPGQKLVVVEGVRRSTDEESMIVAANRALMLERYDAALEMFNTLYGKNQRDPRILMGRAVAQQKSGHSDDAIASYEELLARNPNNADAIINMMGLMKQQDPAAALQRMQDLQSRFPNHPGLAAQIGITQAEMGNNAEAIRYLGMAASMQPTNPQHYFNMGVIADRQGSAADAIRYYEQALQIDSVNGGRGLPRDVIYDRLAVLRRG